MDWIVGDLPLHPLLVHFTVVIIPLAALCVVLSAVWPAARRRLGIVTPLVALAALIAVPITIEAGEWLLERVETTDDIARHESLADVMLPWAIAMCAVAVVQWLWYRFGTKSGRTLRLAATIVLAVAAAVVAVGSIVTIVQIGETGARSVWSEEIGDDS